MTVILNRFMVGTKERPTMFMMRGGELSENPECAMLLESRVDAELEIERCDQPQSFKIYDVRVEILDI